MGIDMVWVERKYNVAGISLADYEKARKYMEVQYKMKFDYRILSFEYDVSTSKGVITDQRLQFVKPPQININ